MSKKKEATKLFSVAFRVTDEISVNIRAESMEKALEAAKGYSAADVRTTTGDAELQDQQKFEISSLYHVEE